jgi:ferrochelatase
MKKALLLINLGTPKSTDPKDVGTYLNEFLTDGDVIDIPYLLRQFLVRVLIVPRRKFQAAKNYAKVWLPEGSPLLVYTERLVKKLQKNIEKDFFVTYAMRYAGPSIKEKLTQLKEDGFDKIYAMPVYPHDTKSSVTTVTKQIDKACRELKIQERVITIPPFYNEDFYLDSYAHLIKETAKDLAKPFVLFSYHGIPQHHIPEACLGCLENSQNECKSLAPIADCYRAQCIETSHLIAKRLGLTQESYMTSFQSRLGKRPWIKPYSDEVIHRLSQEGKRNLVVATPSFLADCLETLEEVAMELKADFEALGDDHQLRAVPCVNDDDYFVDKLSYFVKQLDSVKK